MKRTKKIIVELKDGSAISRTPIWDMLGNWGFTTVRYQDHYWLVNPKDIGSDIWVLSRKLEKYCECAQCREYDQI